MSERMNKERAIKLLKNDCCYECSWGCRNPIECNNKECDYKQAIITAIDSLDNEWVDVKDGLPKEEEKYYLVDTDYGIEIMKWHENPLSKTSNGNGGYKNVWEFKIDDFENKAYKEKFINAWRPLPQPYKRKGGK